MKPRIIGFVATGMLCLGLLVPAVWSAESTSKANPPDRKASASDPDEMTPEEITQLEQRGKELRRQLAQGRSVNGGTMNQAERAQIKRELDSISSRLYRQKHSVRKSASQPEVAMAKPEKPQPDRAPQEAASGQLTPSEAQRLEAREAALRQQIADDRSASGGKLTAGEREQLSKELDEISTNLSRLKHDSQPTQEK